MFLDKFMDTKPLTCFVWLAYRAKVGSIFVFVSHDLVICFTEAVWMDPFSAWTLTLKHSKAWAVLI